MNTTKAIYEALADDAVIVSALDTFDGLPAIFDDQAPDGYLVQLAEFCIVSAAPTRDDAADTLTEEGREVVRDLRIYGKRSSSVAALDDLAILIRDKFHAHPDVLSIDGGSCYLATATGPVAAPTTDPSLAGRRVTLRLQIQRNP